jgi:hypothetical protein
MGSERIKSRGKSLGHHHEVLRLRFAPLRMTAFRFVILLFFIPSSFVIRISDLPRLQFAYDQKTSDVKRHRCLRALELFPATSRS